MDHHFRLETNNGVGFIIGNQSMRNRVDNKGAQPERVILSPQFTCSLAEDFRIENSAGRIGPLQRGIGHIEGSLPIIENEGSIVRLHDALGDT